MYKNLKIIAYLPARKNSKGIKDKNLRLIGGKPLVELTILQAVESRIFDQIVVSTDSKRILTIANKFNCISTGLRPSVLASDFSKIIDAIKYDFFKIGFDKYDCLVLLQPTSPLRTKNDIKEAIDLHINNNYSSVVSVYESEEKLHLLRSLNVNNTLKKLTDTSSDIRRQDSKQLFCINGAIYVNKVKDLLLKDFAFNENILPYLMPVERSIDIDTILDLKLARKYNRKMRKTPNENYR